MRDEPEEMTLELYDELKGPRYKKIYRRRQPGERGPSWYALYEYFTDMGVGDADPDIGDR